MAREISRKEFLQNMQLGCLLVDQVGITDEMETMAGYFTEWIAKCREGNVPAWVLYGQMHYELWAILDKLENMFGPGGVSEPPEVDA